MAFVERKQEVETFATKAAAQSPTYRVRLRGSSVSALFGLHASPRNPRSFETIALGQVPPAKQTTLIKAGHVLDVRSGRYLDNQGILVEETRIVSVGPYAQIESAAPLAARLIDLSHATVLPGLIDCHTHLLMVEKLQNLVQMSTAERALLGASVARDALDAGITTVRDLGNSGVGGDVALRNAIRAGWTTARASSPLHARSALLAASSIPCGLAPPRTFIRVSRDPTGGASS